MLWFGVWIGEWTSAWYDGVCMRLLWYKIINWKNIISWVSTGCIGIYMALGLCRYECIYPYVGLGHT